MGANGVNLTNAVQLVPPNTTARVGAQLSAIPRVLDANGQLEVAVRNTPKGPISVLEREQFLDATQLLAAFREIVREEIGRAFKELKARE